MSTKLLTSLKTSSRYNTVIPTLAPHVFLPATVHLIDLTHKRLLLFQCFLQYHSCHLKGTERLVTSGNSQVVHKFILLVLTDLLYIRIYFWLTSTNRYSKGEESILWKDNFPIHPSELTKSSGINKAEVLQHWKGSVQKGCDVTAATSFIYILHMYTYIYTYICMSVCMSLTTYPYAYKEDEEYDMT